MANAEKTPEAKTPNTETSKTVSVKVPETLVGLVDQLMALNDANELVYRTKVNGVVLQADFKRMHASWLDVFLQKAAQRTHNDTLSGLEPAMKLEESRKLFEASNSGEARPERAVANRAPRDPVEELALKMARETLKATFVELGFGSKISEFVRHDAAAKYFNESNVWITDRVREFIDNNKTEGLAYDFMAEAKAQIEKQAQASVAAKL